MTTQKASRDVVDLVTRPITQGIDVDGDNSANFRIDGTGIGLSNPGTAAFSTITMTGHIDMGGQRINNVSTPLAGTDAVNRDYVTTQDASTLASANAYTDSQVGGGGGGGATTLAALTDTSVGGVSDDELLIYSSGNWRNKPQGDVAPRYMVVNNPVTVPAPVSFPVTPDTGSPNQAAASYWLTVHGQPNVTKIINATSTMTFNFTPQVDSYFIVHWRHIHTITGITPGQGAMGAIANVPASFIGLQNSVFLGGTRIFINGSTWDRMSRGPQISSVTPGSVIRHISTTLNLSRLDEVGGLPGGASEPTWPNALAGGTRIFTAGTPYTISLELAFVTETGGGGFWNLDVFGYANRALGILIPVKDGIPM